MRLTTSLHNGPIVLEPRYLLASKSYRLHALNLFAELEEAVEASRVSSPACWFSTIAFQSSSAEASTRSLLSLTLFATGACSGGSGVEGIIGEGLGVRNPSGGPPGVPGTRLCTLAGVAPKVASDGSPSFSTST